MNERVYDKVGAVSVLLNDKINELKNCQAEKKELLDYIDNLEKKGQLEKNAEIVRKRMRENKARYTKVVKEIEKLEGVVQKPIEEIGNNAK